MSTRCPISGFVDQTHFSLRLFIQWISSERPGHSVVPLAFWPFSIADGAAPLACAIHRQNPVFIVGQSAGVFVYARNLQLIRHEQRREGETGAVVAP